MKIDTSLLKLNIGSGHHRAEGWTNLDRSLEAQPDILFDLADIPQKRIPLLSDSVDLFLCSHILEHIPNILPVMEELYRIAKPGASMCVRVPYGVCDIAYEDPTHCRHFFENSMSYFGQPAYARDDCGYRGDWKETNRIISLHPKIKKVFDKSYKPSAEELIEGVRGYRNMATEIIFELQAVKPARPTTGVQEDAVQVSFIWDESIGEDE